MTSSESTTGRDIVISLLLLSGVSVGGPLFFPEVVSVEESGLLLGAVFATLVGVAVLARLFGTAIGIGRVLLVAVILGTGLWVLGLYVGHQKQAQVAEAFTDAVVRFEAGRDGLRERLIREGEELALPPALDRMAISDFSKLPEYRRQAGAYRAWVDESRAIHLDALDSGIEDVRDAAGTNPDPDTGRLLRDFEDEASRVTDYWLRHWDAELQATEVTLELLELLEVSPGTVDLPAGGYRFENASDQKRYDALSSRLAGIRNAQAADREEFAEGMPGRVVPDGERVEPE